MPQPDLSPMAMSLGGQPWQALPEMARDRAAERAGIEASLMLVEIFHHHHARRLPRQPALLRLGAAVAAARLRADIVDALK